jgi:hypothetical protein
MQNFDKGIQKKNQKDSKFKSKSFSVADHQREGGISLFQWWFGEQKRGVKVHYKNNKVV